LNLSQQWTQEPAIVEIEPETRLRQKNVDQQVYAVTGSDKFTSCSTNLITQSL